MRRRRLLEARKESFVLFSALAYLVCVIALIWALNRLDTSLEGTSRLSVIGATVLECALFAWAMFASFGGVSSSSGLAAGLVPLAMQTLAGCVLFAPAIRRSLAGVATKLRPAAVLCSIPLGFFLIEFPYSSTFFQMEPRYVGLNLALVAGFVLAVWLFAQRRMWGVVLGLAACLVAGLADYFLMLFKGTTILPSDVLALSTAAQVAGGYAPVFEDPALVGLAVFFFYSALMVCLPNPNLTPLRVSANVALACLAVFGLVHWYSTTDIGEEWGVKVDVWSSEDSYMAYGAVPCFLQRLQEVQPEAPAGYDTQEADDLIASLAAQWDAEHPGYPQSLAEYYRTCTDAEAPSVVAIMNESFSDLSIYGGVKGYAGTTYVNGLDTVDSGTLYVSARGGGTCNTEFEFLTGSSLGMIGGGVYPYMYYDLSHAEALPNLFASLGYTTTAVHPCEASNWRRDVVYDELSFSQFLSDTSLPPDAATLRDKVRDSETYALALNQLEQDGPQFVFDVTYMGHGGYTSGLLNSYPYNKVQVNGKSIEGMSEYLSVMDEAQADLAWFLNELSHIDKHVVVVFFGDHQPGFNEELAEAAGQTDPDSLEQVQRRFSTQYFVWANFDLADDGSSFVDDEASTDRGISVGYLGARAMYELGLPLSDMQKARLKLMESMPVTNLNGYLDAFTGKWYWNGFDSPIKDVYDEYAVIQYRNLFDN